MLFLFFILAVIVLSICLHRLRKVVLQQKLAEALWLKAGI
jgi:hypothetical protein